MSDEKSAVRAAMEKADKWHTPLSGVTLADMDDLCRREIVERVQRYDLLIAAVKALLPYAETRAEDLSEQMVEGEGIAAGDEVRAADKAWKAVHGAQALLVEIYS